MAERGLRYVNRQRGAGTRVLLDHELARRGISPEAIVGYEREEHTHLAVAAAVAAGRADCGLGVLAAARAFGLDFVPVAKEPYDLVFEPDPILDPLWALLESEEFRRAVEELGGYDTHRNGPPDPLTHDSRRVLHTCDVKRGESGRARVRVSAGLARAALVVAGRWPKLGPSLLVVRPHGRARRPGRCPR